MLDKLIYFVKSPFAVLDKRIQIRKSVFPRGIFVEEYDRSCVHAVDSERALCEIQLIVYSYFIIELLIPPARGRIKIVKRVKINKCVLNSQRAGVVHRQSDKMNPECIAHRVIAYLLHCRTVEASGFHEHFLDRDPEMLLNASVAFDNCKIDVFGHEFGVAG